MALTVHSIVRHSVQFLAKRSKGGAETYITVRLYDADDVSRGVALFESYKSQPVPTPIGDHDAQTVRVYFEISLYEPFIALLRRESPVFLKASWVQQTSAWTVSQVSIDSKEEIVGEFFEDTGGR